MMRDEEKRVQIEKIQTLLAYFEQQTNPEIHEQATELLRALMDLHSDCLGHIISAITDRGDAGKEILNDLAEDESVSGLLILYGLHPLPLQERVTRAIDELGKTLKSHNASVELVAVDDGVVRLRLTANGGGCHSSPATLKELINEKLLGVAPDLAEVAIEEMQLEPKIVFVPLESLTKARPVAKAGSLG
jgi:Fe-S cluster biogenesis protein NfuA